MKPEDLIINKTYKYKDQPYKYMATQREFFAKGPFSVYIFQNLTTQENEFFDEEYLAFIEEVTKEELDNIKKIKEPKKYIREIVTLNSLEETKTIPVPRKPEEIRIELTNEETIQALTLFGYSLEGYEFGRGHNLSIFTLNLKKEANEKTKAN